MLRNFNAMAKVKKDSIHNPVLLTLKLTDLYHLYPNLKRELNLSTDADKQAARGNVSAHARVFAFVTQTHIQCLVVAFQKTPG